MSKKNLPLEDPAAAASPPPSPAKRAKFTTMRAIVSSGEGPDALRVLERPRPTPSETEVLVKVHASGLNRIDRYMAGGAFGAIEILGMEIAGTIEALGSKVSGSFKVGDRVMALMSDSGLAEYAVADKDLLMPIPAGVTMAQAAAIPEQWLTAFQLLHLVGDLQKGDTVLIHAGGSGVGTAAIQLAVLAGATAYVTAGTDAKIANAVKLGATGGFNYKTEDWAEGMLKATAGRGANVILDCVGGSHAERNAAVLAMEARWVLFGLMGGRDAPGKEQGFFGTLLRKRASIRASTLRTRPKAYKAALVQRFLADALPHIASGKIKIVIDSTYAVTDILKAYQHQKDNNNIGKIVVDFSAKM